MALTKRFPAGQLNRMIENLKAAGKQYGIQFNEFTILSNSHMALAAGEYAKEKGKFHEFHEEAFNAYFTQGKDIGDINIVSSIAEKIGLDSRDLLKNIQEGKYDNILEETQQIAHENGINSTPTFIIDNKYAVVGAQAIESFREALLQIEKEQVK
ncbi:DsbA-like protein [Clostridiales bacterium oral taxon 876 str. F0540]|nr:DsbA-like protein [Clostridiales bacterium oral taxon 876 str. F0540]